ncbi:Nitrate excretion transporter 1 [Morus notabilis]|uniref:Nitrate excretion transporter 1 n=1 Tax=Morus notabilis TaxID=981085 RepID=W9SYR9_9ROSA|nr:protein NRT1/ PTR FAMILY 2.3 [Morus notabilis]EXC33223.1 Nitrate excretion transporter 1 [Morus notabilis]
MANSESQELDLNESVSVERQAQTPLPGGKKGGWITFPFVIGSFMGLALTGGGLTANLMVYLIQEIHVKSIDATQISNVVSGCVNFFPIVGAIIADSSLGCFSVVLISSCITLLGMTLLNLTATLDPLRPLTCERESSFCKLPSKLQLAVLYGGIAVVSIGIGGWHLTMATVGANQFDKHEDQEIFFNWYFFTFYTSAVISSTAIVYIQDNVSWAWGFGICVVSSLIGSTILLLGKRFFHRDKPQSSPFIGLARVVVASIKKRKVLLSSRIEDYYYGRDHGKAKTVDVTPSKSFRFLNGAALKTEGDLTDEEGSIAKPWRLCTIQQVEDFKNLMRIFPLWSSSIFLSTPIAILLSLTILQALTMDVHLGPHFKIPASSILVLVLITTSIFLTLIDHLLCPTWQKLTRHSPTPLQQIGLGHVLNILSMVVSALVESKRLRVAHNLANSNIVPMLAVWLFPQLKLAGIGEAFHFPGQVSLYYQEFPASLRNTATAMVSMVIGIAFYLSTALIDLVRRVTAWLPDDMNRGRLDNVYWTVVVIGVLNFGYYLVCAKLYKYQNNVDHEQVVNTEC